VPPSFALCVLLGLEQATEIYRHLCEGGAPVAICDLPVTVLDRRPGEAPDDCPRCLEALEDVPF
jgi:hypothetical protein